MKWFRRGRLYQSLALYNLCLATFYLKSDSVVFQRVCTIILRDYYSTRVNDIKYIIL